MTYQPKDVSHWTYDENKFQKLNTILSLRDDSQSATSKHDIDPDKYELLQSDEVLGTNITYDSINENSDSCATPTLAPSYHNKEQSLLEGEFELFNPLQVPANEVTITTTTSDAENNKKNDTVNNTSLEFDLDESEYEKLTPDMIETILKETWDQFSLKDIDNSIQQRTMSVEIQPPITLRPRYQSDGTRQIEKSRTKPMAIKLPNLEDIQLEPNQLFLLRLILTTYSKNPSDQVYLHINKLEYHSEGVQELNDGTICVPLTRDDINEGKKVLPRLSIIKTKLGAYKSELTPFSLSKNEKELPNNMDEDESEKISVKEAKTIFKKYNMEFSRIACQLLIKQNESWHFTNITCESHVIREKDQTNTTKKRSANAMDSDDEESLDERPTTSKSKSAKQKKRSNC